MFVKHCPDAELASVFKYKQIHEWTSKDIQERLDEHQRERVSSIKTLAPKPLHQHHCYAMRHMLSPESPVMCQCLSMFCPLKLCSPPLKLRLFPVFL